MVTCMLTTSNSSSSSSSGNGANAAFGATSTEVSTSASLTTHNTTTGERRNVLINHRKESNQPWVYNNWNTIVKGTKSMHESWLCSRGERSHDNSLSFKIREDVDDLYKWQMFWRTSLHQCQISHADNNIAIIHDIYRGCIDIIRLLFYYELWAGLFQLEKVVMIDKSATVRGATLWPIYRSWPSTNAGRKMPSWVGSERADG